jgi:hypothetical protein
VENLADRRIYEQYLGQRIKQPATQAHTPSVEALALKYELVL